MLGRLTASHMSKATKSLSWALAVYSVGESGQGWNVVAKLRGRAVGPVGLVQVVVSERVRHGFVDVGEFAAKGITAAPEGDRSVLERSLSSSSQNQPCG